jgi:hypothetical protein
MFVIDKKKKKRFLGENKLFDIIIIFILIDQF